MWLELILLVTGGLAVGQAQVQFKDDFEANTLLLSNWEVAAGYDLQSSACGTIASGNSIVFSASTQRYLVSQPTNTTQAVGLQFVFGKSGCGINTTPYSVFVEYRISGTSYLLKELRNTSATNLYTIQLPILARREGVQFSWTQANGFQLNEAVWQLDNVALLYANEINSALLNTFSGSSQSSSVMFSSGGIIENNVCNTNQERLSFVGNNQLSIQHVLTTPFLFDSPKICSAPCICGPGEYSDDFDSTYSYHLWEKVLGGQVQKPPCDTSSNNPALVFSTSDQTELVTVPLNFTNVRLITFDLQIFNVFLNNLCYMLSNGDVILSYRLGANGQWKILNSYASNDYFNVGRVSVMISDCMQTCGIQLKWHFSSIETNALWCIDNITMSSNSNSMPINRRDTDELGQPSYSIQKRQAISGCSYYYDNFDNGTFNTELWSSLSGGNVSLTPCGVPNDSHYWLYFAGSGTQSVITQLLDLQGFSSLTFNLLFRSRINRCGSPTNNERISVEYSIGNNGPWVTMEYYNSSCCTASTEHVLHLPPAAQVNNVVLRWHQHTQASSNLWAIDEVKIGTVTPHILYEDQFTSGYNSSIWLSISGGSVRQVCTQGFALYFTGNQAVTQHLNLEQAISFSVSFTLGSANCNGAESGKDIEVSWRIDGGEWSLLNLFPFRYYKNLRYIYMGPYNSAGISTVQFRISTTVINTYPVDSWFIDNFRVNTFNESSCIMAPAVAPTSPLTPPVCNSYSDNFDVGNYKTSLWYTVSGIRILYRPCSLPSTLHYAAYFYFGSRQLITQMLDLRGVEFITFYSRASINQNGGCTTSINSNMTVSYSIAGSSIWKTLQEYTSVCCRYGSSLSLYLPVEVQTTLIQLRWQHFPGSPNEIWIVDNVQIGESVDTVLYQDNFATSVSSTLWSSVYGSNVTTSPCGTVDEGNALYFPGEGIREAITQMLDLRQANYISFFMTVSCNRLEVGETVEISIRADHGSWRTLQSISNIQSKYIYIDIPEDMKVQSAQLRWMQNIQALRDYDVWAIDSIKIHSTNPRTVCSTACISDNFDLGTYDTSVWSIISGAQVATPPCSTKTSSMALHFNQNSTRQAVTQPLDLRGMYAIGFTLQIIMHNQVCYVYYGNNDVVVYYSTNPGFGWVEIKSFRSTLFLVETYVTIPLPIEARRQSIFIRIAQPSYTSTISQWSLDDFGIYSPDQCPPLLVLNENATTVMPPTPTPLSPNNLACNYYWDDFNTGSYKDNLWSSFNRAYVTLPRCRSSVIHQHGVSFQTGASSITTHALNLQGVEAISFYLRSSSSDCYPLYIKGAIVLSYRRSINEHWYTLERFEQSCCIDGRNITVHIPPSIRTSSARLSWSTAYPYATRYPYWELDDIQIGTFVQTKLYGDDFSNGYDPSLWLMIVGGYVRFPSTYCGEAYSGNALIFSQAGNREAITKYLDLTYATSLSFYIRTRSTNSFRCNQPEQGEGVQLSYRINNNDWIVLQTFSYSLQSYVYIEIEEMLQVNGVQFCFKQQVLGSVSYDVWSIDHFFIHSTQKDTKCSLACYSDNFNSGSLNSELWSSVVVASVTIPPCSDDHHGNSLYFTDGGTREAVTNSLDLRGLYAISFTLQIGSFDNDCDQAEAGENVVLYYLTTDNSNWVELEVFNATAYTRATRITVPVPRVARVQGVTLRWAQPQHSGTLEDTWFIDDIGVYSPDECPPVAYQTPETPQNPLTIPSANLQNSNLQCNYYFDSFDDGSFKTSLWQAISQVTVSDRPYFSRMFVAVFRYQYNNFPRQLVTKLLDLRGVEFVSFFYAISGYSTYAPLCVQYKVISWTTLECYYSGVTTTTMYLPSEARVSGVQLRWIGSTIPYGGRNNDYYLDDVEIGEAVHTILYQESFTYQLHSLLWSSVVGGTVTTPTCGALDAGNALIFSADGTREATMQFLDLNQATAVSFYISVGCDGLDHVETIELSIRAGHGPWRMLESISNVNRTYFYVDIPEDMKVHSAQLRWMQNVPAISGYDVWGIDSIQIHSVNSKTVCSTACISDNFNSGTYNASVWSTIYGAQVTVPPCSTRSSGMSLYFNQSGARHAITHPLDLRGMYAVSFYLQIVQYNDLYCSSSNQDYVTIHYSLNLGDSWIEIKTFVSYAFLVETYVTVALPIEARDQHVSIRIAQPTYTSGVWSLDNFGIYSPDQCPPLSATDTTTVIPPTPTPVESNNFACSYYTDDFDGGLFNSNLWSSFTGVDIVYSPCGLFPMQTYGVRFVYDVRELVTQDLDLRGVETIKFSLVTGNGINGCFQPPDNGGVYVSYRVSGSSLWSTLEYFVPDCCINTKNVTIYIPVAAQLSSVQLRWSQPTYESIGRAEWGLGGIQIGTIFQTELYMDAFTNSYDPSVWIVVLGGSVIAPPCGATHSGGALYFSQEGKREAITDFLDLRDAKWLQFYIRIGHCNPAERGEDVQLSYRMRYTTWTVIRTFVGGGRRDSVHVNVPIEDNLRANEVQFLFKQQVIAVDGYDDWSIDSFVIYGIEKDTKCSLACYSDNFNSGSLNSELWSSVVVASVTIPPCSDDHHGNSLYFTDGGTREAVTNSLDLRGLYAISFTLQIGSFDNDCDQAEAGENVVLYYLTTDNSNWVELEVFSATAYTRATRITVLVPRVARVQGVTLRWAQPQHSGTLEDTWFIDDIGVYSPDECPPVAYQTPETPQNPPAVPSSNLPNNNLQCNYYFDNFDDGSFKTSLWQAVSGKRILSAICNLPPMQHYAVESYTGNGLDTTLLDLRGVRYITFYLFTGHGTTGCLGTNSGWASVSYRIGSDTSWHSLESFTRTCCINGATIMLYLPIEVQVSSAQLRWELAGTVVLDDVQIGSVMDTILYEDLFTSNPNSSIWSSITGGHVTLPPCGTTDSGSALFFSASGIREAITVPLDLRQATTLTFYLRIGSDDSSCENADGTEDIELLYKIGAQSWTLMQTYTSTLYRSARYIYVVVTNQLKVNGVQFKIAQTVLATSSYDVWSIDSFTVHSTALSPECSEACYVDTFYNDYDATLWSSVSGGSVGLLMCISDNPFIYGLYFNGSGERLARTNNLDLTGLYTITLGLQIVLSGNDCLLAAPSGEDVVISYSINNGTWYEIERFSSEGYHHYTDVVVGLPLDARQPNVSIQIIQPHYMESIWIINKFGVHSPDSCPPRSYASSVSSMPPAPLPYPSPSTVSVCNYYSDNFDNGFYKTSLWNRVTGVRIALQPCGLSHIQHYGMEFYSFGSREMTTNPIDLRGVEFIRFYLISGTTSNGCSAPNINEGIYVAYKLSDSLSYVTLEYFVPSCCTTGTYLRLYLPSDAQTTSVTIRWYQSTHSPSESSDVWILDDVQIGYTVDDVFYEDHFTNTINNALWLSIEGASVLTPPCGVTHSSHALYFSANGTRQAVTQQLDLRLATALSFYLRIGSHEGTCESSDDMHAISLSWRVYLGSWVQLNAYGFYRNPRYVHISLSENMKSTGVQFRLMQNTVTSSNVDVWSIDDFIVHSKIADTPCTLACYSDDFNNGQFDMDVWSTVEGATIAIPPCSNQYLGSALYFAGNGIRQAVTRALDVRGLYALSFYLHIGSFGGSCEAAESGENVNLYYRYFNSSTWVMMNSYDVTAYTRETRIVEPLSRSIQQPGVIFRWMQVSHSGAEDDTWSLDNFGLHSPNDCPPDGYGPRVTVTPIAPSEVTTSSNLLTSSSVSVVQIPVQPTTSSQYSTTPLSMSSLVIFSSTVVETNSVSSTMSVIMSSISIMEPTPTASLIPDSCAENYDPLNNGVYSSSLWSSLSGVNVEVNPCRARTDDSMLFYGLITREAITVPLNLTDIRSISFILHCGSLVGNCVASNSASITVYYKEASSSIWNTITTYHPADYTSEQFVLLSLPTTARRNSVQLRWYQPSYSGYRRDVWSLDDVVIGATDTPQLSQSVAGYVDDFNSGGYSYRLWDTVIGGIIQVPPCGPIVAGSALHFLNNGTAQLLLTKELDLTDISTVSFYLELNPCGSALSATVVLEYKVGNSPFTIMQILVASGYQIISLPQVVQTTNVQLQWRALLNTEWSIDNVRIGSDALLYYLEFDIQVGSCLPPPINRTVSHFVRLEYYDGSSWSLLEQECLHSRCLQKDDGSMYSENRYYKSQRVVVPLWPLVVQNKPVYQLRWGVSNQVQWSIDNIYIGKDCLHYCQGAGHCTISGNCQCDVGSTGLTCPVGSTNYPESVVLDFDDMTTAVHFPIMYGAELSTQCGILSNGRSLVFKYGKTREIQTRDLNTTRTLYIQFALASGNGSCGGVDVLSENTILLQFSLDQGITWNTLQSLGEISVGVQHYQIVLPQETKYPQTRFRLWQPYAVADDYNVWSIDDILIGGVDRNNPMLAEEFDPFDRNKWSFYQGGAVEPYCNSSGNSLHFSGNQIAASYLSTSEFYVTFDTFIQFELITSCASSSQLTYYIQLEYSKDGGLTWSKLNVTQDHSENQNLYQSTYYQVDFANTWRRVILPISNPDVYGTAVRLRWRQGGNTVGEWALDNIVIGNRMLHCPQLCNRNGRCTLNSVCICDEGYSGDQCDHIDRIFPSYMQESFEEQLDSSLWPVNIGGNISRECGVVSSGKALVFNDAGYRHIATSYLNLIQTTCIRFTIQIGSATNLTHCQLADNPQQNVTFGYSLNGGMSWTTLETFQPTNYIIPQEVIVLVTDPAQQPAVQLGWWQTAESQRGAFAIDNVIIGSSAIEYEAFYNDSFESGNYSNLWWSVSSGATVSPTCGHSNALVFGDGLTQRIATTRPLAIPDTPLALIVLYEGFNNNDVSQLTSEGWYLTGHISLHCGSLYGNGSGLSFLTEGERSVITKPIDTTYATHVSFYLMFGGDFCSGINDGNRGVWLSYSNGDSNGWVQIAFFSDTIYFSSAKKVTEELPIAARRSNTMLRWQQPNHSFRILVDIWSIDEITVYKRPVKYNLQFSYTTGCITNTSELQVEYISSYTNCGWRSIHQFIPPTTCSDLQSTYLQPVQFLASSWTRVTLSLPPEAFAADTQFRWRGQENCHDCHISLDDVYIRPGCPNNCNNQGVCVNGECSCSDEYSGPACIPASTVMELREEFSQYPLNPLLWSFVSGNNGNLLSRCGRLTGLYSLSFSGNATRELITVDINTVDLYFIQFMFRLGGRGTGSNCNSPSDPSESVIFQYSIDGGASWDNVDILCYNQYQTTTHLTYELTPQSKTVATRFRWWQPSHSGLLQDEWAITDVYIGGNLVHSTIIETFDPIDNNYWLFYSGASLTEHCSSQGNALVFYRDGFVSTRDFYITNRHVIQFEVNLLACSCDPPFSNASFIQLEYSVDRGNSWRSLSAESVFSPTIYQHWQSVSLTVPNAIADQTVRLQWVQRNTGYSCWALDNIMIEASLNFMLSVVSSRSILLSWEPAVVDPQSGVVARYHVIVIETQMLYLTNGTVVTQRGVNGNRTYDALETNTQLIDNLHPSYRYTVRIAAATATRMGPFSAAKSITTLEDAPSGAPLNAYVTIQSSTSIMLTWEPPLLDQQNGRIVEYHVVVTESLIDGTLVEISRNFTYNATDVRAQHIAMLSPNRNYAVKVAAATNSGIGPYSNEVHVTIPEDGTIPPMPPSNVMIYGTPSYRPGSSLQLRCASFGDPPLVYMWTRSTYGVNNPFPSNIITNNNILYINNMTVTDGGTYICTVTNNVGSASTAVAIHTLESLSTSFQEQSVNVMQTVQLTCEFRGIPLPTVNWSASPQVNLSGAIASGRILVTTDPTINHRIVSVLTIQTIQLEEAGRYTCTAETVGLSESVIYEITTVPLLQATAQSIRTLESQPIRMDCIPTPYNIAVTWMFNGNPILGQSGILFAPANLDHTLIISSADVHDSGAYRCQVVGTSLVPVSRTILLNVLETCEPEYSHGLLWGRHQSNQLVHIRCSAFHSNFRSGVYITRMCDENGEWGEVDFSMCTMKTTATPLIVFEVNTTTSPLRTSAIVNEMTFSVARSGYDIANSSHQMFTVSSATIVIVSVAINNAAVSDSITSIILENLITGNDQPPLITAFQPKYQCSCNDRVEMNSSNSICIGPSVSPCTMVDGRYQCAQPTYAGNGRWCGLDSDSDGYPDVQLDCPDRHCEQDACPNVYNENDINIPDPCMMEPETDDTTSTSCGPEIDTFWGIQWHRTSAGSTAAQKCPGLAEATGIAYRNCLSNAYWDVTIDVSQCQTVEFMLLDNRVQELQDILNSNTASDARDLTVMFDVAEVQAVSEELTMLTDTSQGPILPSDVSTANAILNTLISVTRTTSMQMASNNTEQELDPIVETASITIDNLISSAYYLPSQASQNVESSPSAEDLLMNIENFAMVIGDVLLATSSNGGNATTASKTITRENIVFNAQLPPVNPELITDVVFPEVGDTQITIPADAIIHQRRTEGTRAPVVSFLAKNLHNQLNNVSSGDVSGIAAAMLISSQISYEFIELPENGLVKLKFDNFENITVLSPQCVYWDYNLTKTSNEQVGGWSTDGIIQDADRKLPVLCSSTHLTSFCVLVGSESVQEIHALRIVSYIGCGISIVCLLLTITAIVVFRKKAFEKKHNKVHLNLSIALLLGLVTFVSGIESATGNKVACILVTTLLHYFFLSVFSWTLCEGIIIFAMFVTVFYHGFFQRMKFFLLLGWGLPIPIVALSAGLSYEHYGISVDGKKLACWISNDDGAIWAFTAPMALINLVNVFFLAAAVIKVYKSRKMKFKMNAAEKSRFETARAILLSILALLPLLGCTWILGLLFLVNSESEALAWIFTIVNSMQGFAIFFFHVVRNKEVISSIQEYFKKAKPKSEVPAATKDTNDVQFLSNQLYSPKISTLQSNLGVIVSGFSTDHQDTSFITEDDVYVDDDQATLTNHDAMMF